MERRWCCKWRCGVFVLSIVQGDGRKFCGMVYEFSCSAKLGIYIPQLDWWFMYNILDITRLGLSCGLIFNMKVVSVMLYMDNLISTSPFQIPFAWLFIFKVLCLPLESQVQDSLLSSEHIWTSFCPMFSWLWQEPDDAFPDSGIQNLGHQESVAWIQAVSVRADLHLTHKWGRRVFHLMARFRGTW